MQRLAGEGQGAACASYAGISQPPTAEIGESKHFWQSYAGIAGTCRNSAFAGRSADGSNFTIFCALNRPIFTNYQEIKGIVG
jgi:hypothetical protein